MASPFSTGDVIALGALVLLGLEHGARALGWLTGKESRIARHTAETDVRADGFSSAIEGLTNEIRRSNDQFHDHELECAQFRGETVSTLKSIAQSLDRQGRNIEQMQSQIRFVATSNHDTAFRAQPKG